MRVTLLDPKNPNQPFPPVCNALEEPNGLLAIGGCLSASRILNAYRNGIFPWYNPSEPILWWSPNPRLVVFPEQLHISRSLAKTLRKNSFNITFDQCFSKVMQACAKPRSYANGTWIDNDILRAYQNLHQQGITHSVEVWHKDELVGGLYGLALGQVFFGESMFHTMTDASKVAFVILVQKLKDWNFQLIDCQVHTGHLISLGAEEIDRMQFVAQLDRYCALSSTADAWKI
jgi:leucyl/phenylalanyl-tRNA---protein transferase